MALDPQLEQLLAQAAEWPGFRGLPVADVREAVRASSTALPPAPDLVPARVENRTIEGAGGPLALRIYWPEGEGPFPVTQFMHGGGFVVGDLDTEDMVARALCVLAGTIVVSVAYRLAPEHPFPAAIDDGWAALGWVAAHAHALGGDPSRLALAGGSAGANLSAAIAIRARDHGGPALRAQILIYGSCNYPSEERPSAREYADGPIITRDDVSWFWEQFLQDPARQQDDPMVSPYRAASHAGLPPAFIVSAECDPTRDDGEAYGEKLTAAGVEAEVKRYAGMPHGFVSWLAILPAAREAVEDASRFLRKQFGA